MLSISEGHAETQKTKKHETDVKESFQAKGIHVSRGELQSSEKLCLQRLEPRPRRIPTPPLFLLRASPSMSETDDAVTHSHVLFQTDHENFMKGFFKFPFNGYFVRGWD